jgi:hypothetical protein
MGVITAVFVNSFVLFLADLEDMTPAVINGSMVGGTACAMHSIRHALSDGKVKKDWNNEDRIVNFACWIFASVASSVLLLRLNGYPANKWDIARMEVLSVLTVAGTKKFILNED